MSPLGLVTRRRGNEHGFEMRFRLPRLAYVAGEAIEGTLVARTREPLEHGGIVVALQRVESTFDGDVNRTAVETLGSLVLVDVARHEAGSVVERPFRLRVPTTYAPTHSSPHGTIRWRLGGYCDRKGFLKGEYRAFQEVTVHAAFQPR